jgi:DHA2 family multidrug resistance protein-like MFS transporter
MDLTVLHLAVPHLSAELRPSAVQLLWILDIYGFLVAGSLVTMGTLGDRIGRRRRLLIGAAGFSVTSLLAAFAPTAETLIVARALMGVAGATIAPSTLSLIFNMFRDPAQRATAIGVWISGFSAGSAIGPILGGALIEYFWWGSVFLLALPVMGLLLLLGPRVLPEFHNPAAGRLDVLGAAMSLVSLLAIIFGLKQIAQDGLVMSAAAAILAGLAVGGAFVRRQLALPDPLIDIRLFRRSSFRASVLVNLVGVFIGFGYYLFVAQYLQLVRELSPLDAGLWSLPSALGFVVSSNVAPRVMRRLRPAHVLGVCLGVTAVGLAALLLVSVASGFAALITVSVVVSLALAPLFSLTTELIVGAAPPERAGSASAISETAAEVGGAVGIAILGSLGTAVYRTALAANLPASIPTHLGDAARHTLGAAVAVAQELSGDHRDVFLAITREAFVQGLHVVAAVSAAMALVAAILAVIQLRRVPAGQG